MKERERVEIDPFVKEMLLVDAEFVAWLVPHGEEVEEDEPGLLESDRCRKRCELNFDRHATPHDCCGLPRV